MSRLSEIADRYVASATEQFPDVDAPIITLAAGLMFFADQLAEANDQIETLAHRLATLESELSGRTVGYPAPGTLVNMINWDSAPHADQQARTIVTILTAELDVLRARLSELEGAKTSRQNDSGVWVSAIPLPYYGLRKRCDCGRRFWTMDGYRGHYALTHVAGGAR